MNSLTLDEVIELQKRYPTTTIFYPAVYVTEQIGDFIQGVVRAGTIPELPFRPSMIFVIHNDKLYRVTIQEEAAL